MRSVQMGQIHLNLQSCIGHKNKSVHPKKTLENIILLEVIDVNPLCILRAVRYTSTTVLNLVDADST